MKEKLKPCPFCGGAVTIMETRSFDDEICVGVQCLTPGCLASTTFAFRDAEKRGVDDPETLEKWKAFAAEQWNRRAGYDK